MDEIARQAELERQKLDEKKRLVEVSIFTHYYINTMYAVIYCRILKEKDR